MSFLALVAGAVIGAAVVNMFLDHWDFGDYLFGTFVTSVIGIAIGAGILWLINNVDLDDLATPAAAEAVVVEQVSVEEPSPSEEAPKPQFDFGQGKFE